MPKKSSGRITHAEREIANNTARAAHEGAKELAAHGMGDAARGLEAAGALARDVANAIPGWSNALTAPFFKRGKRVH